MISVTVHAALSFVEANESFFFACVALLLRNLRLAVARCNEDPTHTYMRFLVPMVMI